MVKWYSLFSHTGSETETLWEKCSDKLQLEAAITNNSDYEGPLPYIKLISARYINEWLMEPGNVEPNSLVTLNGYMRILPAEVINYLRSIGCKVWNIHPAPIWAYPELKGADPQERLYEGILDGKYTLIGVVIHEVEPEVDGGKILYWSVRFADPSITKAQLYEDLHEMGTNLWLQAIEEVANG